MSQNQSPRPPADLPGWSTPPATGQAVPIPDPAPLEGTAIPAGDPLPQDPPADDAARAEAAGQPGPKTTTSRTRRGTSSLGKLSQDGLAKAATTVFAGVGEALNGIAAEHPDDDVFLPTDEEADGVGEAAGRMLARHIPDLPGKGADASDIADVIAIVVHLGIYAARSLATWLPRRHRKNAQVAVAAPAAEEGA